MMRLRNIDFTKSTFLTTNFMKSTFITFDPDDEIEKYQNQEISAKLAQRTLLFLISITSKSFRLPKSQQRVL